MQIEAATAMSILPPSTTPAAMMAAGTGEDAAGGSPRASPAPEDDDSRSDPAGAPGTRGRFTREEILAILREQASGTPIVELCRRHGISTTTFFRWRKRYEPPVPAVRPDQSRLWHLEEENRHLKTLLAEAILENAIIRESAGLGSLFGKK